MWGSALQILIREPEPPSVRERKSLRERVKDFPALIREDKGFAWFMVARSLAMGSRIGQPFFVLYAIQALGVSATGDAGAIGSTLAILSLAYMGADTVTNLVWGYLSDRQGFRSTFVISLIVNIIGVGALLMSHSMEMFAIALFLIGAAQLMARYNGLEAVGAIRSTIAEMIETAQLLDALRYTALNRVQIIEGICVPDAVACNLAGLTVTGKRDAYLTFLCELCGGPVLTAPSGLDLANPETSAMVKKYYVGKEGVSAEERLRLVKYIYDVCASDASGWTRASGVTAAGSPGARRVAVGRGFDLEGCVKAVLGEIS